MVRQIRPLIVGLFLIAPVSAADPPAFAEVSPLLTTYCTPCHNPMKKESGTDFGSVTPETFAAKSKLWKRAKGRVVTDEMPPDGAKPLPPAEKAKLVAWLGAAAGFRDCDPTRRDPGPSILRRLTKSEYENTIHDLFGIKFDAGIAVGLPDDPAGEGHFDNLAVNLRLSDALLEKYFAAAEQIVDKIFTPGWPGDGAKRRVFTARPGPKVTDREAVETILRNLLRQAYRRPPQPDDVARLLKLFDTAIAKGTPFEETVRGTLKPILVSPQFLFRIEDDRPASSNSLRAPVSAHELAVRLSYFLWASMPDAELAKLADAGTLTDPAILTAQIRRMLIDPKAKSLAESFAVQWLQVNRLQQARPTQEFFPTFNGQLKDAMKGEVIAFFDHLRTADRPVTELLDADYTFANESLAKHYNLPAVAGDKLQKVSLQPVHHRGGVLGMGAVLAVTSHTFRTSPTQRGKYVLDVIFGTPPPPPPPNVGTLTDDAPKKKEPTTFKEQLARHATQPSCAGCHKKIDPLGFALDNYNAVGQWRESTKQNPLDVSGVLPTGEKVDGVADLKRVILARKTEVVRALTAKVLEYALGRELDVTDDCTIDEIAAATAAADDKFSALILGVATSIPMTHRRAAGH